MDTSHKYFDVKSLHWSTNVNFVFQKHPLENFALADFTFGICLQSGKWNTDNATKQKPLVSIFNEMHA